jgi:hypothetical protein
MREVLPTLIKNEKEETEKEGQGAEIEKSEERRNKGIPRVAQNDDLKEMLARSHLYGRERQ